MSKLIEALSKLKKTERNALWKSLHERRNNLENFIATEMTIEKAKSEIYEIKNILFVIDNHDFKKNAVKAVIDGTEDKNEN